MNLPPRSDYRASVPPCRTLFPCIARLSLDAQSVLGELQSKPSGGTHLAPSGGRLFCLGSPMSGTPDWFGLLHRFARAARPRGRAHEGRPILRTVGAGTHRVSEIAVPNGQTGPLFRCHVPRSSPIDRRSVSTPLRGEGSPFRFPDFARLNRVALSARAAQIYEPLPSLLQTGQFGVETSQPNDSLAFLLSMAYQRSLVPQFRH